MSPEYQIFIYIVALLSLAFIVFTLISKKKVESVKLTPAEANRARIKAERIRRHNLNNALKK